MLGLCGKVLKGGGSFAAKFKKGRIVMEKKNDKKKIGIIGITGRMGLTLADVVREGGKYELGVSFGRSQMPFRKMEEVFRGSDYVIDFSSRELVKKTLETGITEGKPLVICTTGWSKDDMKNLIEPLAEKVPLVIAANTSLGAALQIYLARQLARVLGETYDIDIEEKHQRNKIDCPSGTAKMIFEEIRKVKKSAFELKYETGGMAEGPRPEHYIGTTFLRSGNRPAEHEVSFTSNEEMISIRHLAYSKNVFARGAVKIVEWLDENKPKPGVYSMMDVLGLN